jgi:alpha-amylase
MAFATTLGKPFLGALLCASSLAAQVGCGGESGGMDPPDDDGEEDGDGKEDSGEGGGDDGGEPEVAPAQRVDGPEDWRDEILYFIVTDRFADGDSSNNGDAAFFDRENHFKYHGGDLQGILDHVDYVKELGATAVWITPVVENVFALGSEPDVYTGYHGYSARNLDAVDPHLAGSMQEYQDFVAAMHDSGLRVIQDVVVNHMGSVLKYAEGWDPPFDPGGYTRVFVDEEFPPETTPWVTTNNNQRPPQAPFDQLSSYHSFGRITDWADPEQKLIGDFGTLDDLATERPEVRDALVETYRDWVILGGVDGFRLDTAVHVDETFWDAFSPAMREAVHEANEDGKFIQFGEVFDFSHASGSRYTQDGEGNPRLDSLLNFPLYDAIQAVFARGESTVRLTEELAARTALRGTAADSGGAGLSAVDGAVNFIDNHDVLRFPDSVEVSDDEETKREIMRSALAYILTANGIPCIYYNTENDMVGDPALPPDHMIKGDYARWDMPDFETEGKPTFDVIRDLSAMRKEHVALRRGAMEVLADDTSTDGNGSPLPAGTFVFTRKVADQAAEEVIVFINNSVADVTHDVLVGTDDELAEIYPASDVTHVPVNRRVTVEVPAHGIKLLKRP